MVKTKTISEVIAERASELNYKNIPGNVIEKAKMCILDSLGCSLGASLTEPGKIVLDFENELGYKPESSLFNNLFITSPLLAAFVNSTLANILDFDDFCFGDGHPGATVIPPSLLLANSIDADGKKMLTAIIAGYEVLISIGRAIQPSIFQTDLVHGFGTYQTFGAATSASLLLGLDKRSMTNALGLAGSNAPLPSSRKTVGVEGATMAKNNYGIASLVGILSSQLASKGFKGPIDIFEGDRGFWRMAGSDRWRPELLNDTLNGTNWSIRDVAFKPYPCCRWIHSAIDAALKIRQETGTRLNDIMSVTVETVWILKTKPFIDNAPESMIQAQFSAPYCIAVALSGVSPGMAWFSNHALRSKRILSLSKKVLIAHDPKADRKYPPKIPATVKIRTKENCYEEYIEYPKGEPANPMLKKEIENKFLTLASPALGHVRSSTVMNAIYKMDALKIRKIIGMLFSNHKNTRDRNERNI